MPRDSDRKPSHRELSEGERQPPAGELTYQQGYLSPLTQLDNWGEQLGLPQGSPHWSQMTPEEPQSHRQSPAASEEPATWHDNIPGHSPAGLDEVLLGSGHQSTRSSSQEVVEIDSTAFYQTRRESSHEMHHAAGNPTNPYQDQGVIAPHLLLATAAPHHYEAATQSGSSKGKDKDRASKRSLASTPSSIGSTGSHHRRGQPRKRGKGEPSQSGTSKGKGKERGSQQYTPEAVHRQYVDADSPHEAVGGMSIGPGIQNRRADVSEANADYHRRKNVSDRKSDREKAEKAVKKGLGFSRLDPYHCKEKGYDCKGEDTVEAKPCYQCRALGLQWCIYNPEG